MNKLIIKLVKEDKAIFGLGCFIGIILGANLAIMLYACVLMGKRGDVNEQTSGIKQVAER